MPSRDEAIDLLDAHGEHAAADHVRRWRNADGGFGGWDANVRLAFPAARWILWPDGHLAARARTPRSGAKSRAPLPRATDLPALPPGATPTFDAYVAIDWSARSVPTTGADSIWWARLEWNGHDAALTSGNPATREELTTWLRAELDGRLRDRRVLVGFDFPFGYPRGFAAALGYTGDPCAAWRFVWQRIAAEVTDGPRNENTRLTAAAALNVAVSGGFGPFYGRPRGTGPEIACTLSAKQRGHFEYPLLARNGQPLARDREADRRARTASSAWFVHGGGNSVGGQALVGIPRLLALRDALDDARIWPFETGARCPDRADARVVLAEIYPSRFCPRDPTSPEVHDRLQVEATATHFAAKDAAGELEALFAAPPDDPAVLHEEGWVLGVA
jgi:hypothetical protein